MKISKQKIIPKTTPKRLNITQPKEANLVCPYCNNHNLLMVYEKDEFCYVKCNKCEARGPKKLEMISAKENYKMVYGLYKVGIFEVFKQMTESKKIKRKQNW